MAEILPALTDPDNLGTGVAATTDTDATEQGLGADQQAADDSSTGGTPLSGLSGALQGIENLPQSIGNGLSSLEQSAASGLAAAEAAVQSQLQNLGAAASTTLTYISYGLIAIIVVAGIGAVGYTWRALR